MSNTPADFSPLSLPAYQFDDCIELLDAVYITLHRLEDQLRDPFATLNPITRKELSSLIQVSKAAIRVVNENLLDAEAVKTAPAMETIKEDCE